MTDAQRKQFELIFGFDPEPAPPPPVFVVAATHWNTQQLATYDQARAVAAKINSTLIVFLPGEAPRPMGGGTLPGDDEIPTLVPNPTGIYIAPWAPQPEAPVTDPTTGWVYHRLLLRFLNGKSGFNVGLILDKASRYPLSPDYVIGAIAAEVEV